MVELLTLARSIHRTQKSKPRLGSEHRNGVNTQSVGELEVSESKGKKKKKELYDKGLDLGTLKISMTCWYKHYQSFSQVEHTIVKVIELATTLLLLYGIA